VRPRPATSRKSFVPPSFLAREWHSIDKSTAKKQELLIRTIAENPTYAKYVRELHWTVLDSYHNIAHHRELFDPRPRCWRALYAELDCAPYARGIDMVHEPGSGFRLSASDKLHLTWKMFYDNDNRRTPNEAYESTLSKEREIFPPEDGRLQLRQMKIGFNTIRSSLANISELRTCGERRSVLA